LYIFLARLCEGGGLF